MFAKPFKFARYALVITGFAVIFTLVSVMAGTQPLLAQDGSTPTPTPPHWTYEGEEGPAHWGDLPGYAACSQGRAQSPIDISGAQETDLIDFTFNYQPSAMTILNNGHTIQVNYDPGSSITYNEDQYQLVQFHFHTPSEHTLGGQSFEMELHLVHQDAAGNLAVVGVLLAKGEQDNPAYAAILDHMPAVKGDPQVTDLQINAADLLPQDKLYYTYTGSLTTPPCTQGVRWLVLQTPVELSEHQIEAFKAIYEENARPVQPLNNRDLLEDAQ